MQIIIDEMQYFWCDDKEWCTQTEPYCAPCDGDSEECITCSCWNAFHKMKTKECEHEA